MKTKNAISFFKNAETTMINLYHRWLNESKYENINDYKIPLESIAKKSQVKITKMNKRPFGCNFTTEEKTFVLIMQNQNYEYKRIS